MVGVGLWVYVWSILYRLFFFSSRRRHTRCALVTGVQTCALPIFLLFAQTLLARRNPDTPAWAMRGWTVEAATWTAVIGFFVGISLVAQAVAEATFGWIEAGIIVVMLAVFAIIWSRMRVGKRLAKYKEIGRAS